MAEELSIVVGLQLHAAVLADSPPDRSEWPPGPWDLEPDFLAVEHAGFTGFVKRAWSGALNGYIAIPPGHPWHGKDFMEVRADCHGGPTFSHEMGPWWCIGFDCAHGFDVIPLLVKHSPRLFEGWTYRDFEYVTNEVKGLCQQAADVMRALP